MMIYIYFVNSQKDGVTNDCRKYYTYAIYANI